MEAASSGKRSPGATEQPAPDDERSPPPPAEERRAELLAQKALLARPGLSIRARLTIGFLVVFVVTTGAVVTAFVILTELDGKLGFIERADKFANEIQQCRRYEKNFLLYGTRLTKVLEHLDAARHTLVGAKAEFGRIVGREHWGELERDLDAYAALVYRLAAARRRAEAAVGASAKPAVEGKLRRHGARMVDIAILMSKRERNSVRHMLGVVRAFSLGSLVVLLAAIVYMAHSLSSHFLKRLDFLMGVTQRIGKGDFQPIMPVRRYRDEFTNLAVAMNQMMYELDSRREQLVQAGKIAAVGTLTAGVAHEINNPINNLSLIVESLVETRSMGEAERDRLYQEALTQTDRVSDIVKNLLEFSRANHPRLELTSIQEVVDKTSRLVRNEMKLHKIDFALTVQNRLPELQVDRGGLQQVLLNLLLNAIHEMPDGGKIAVGVRYAAEQDELRIDVTDDGPGISKENLGRIFDPFFTTKREGEGTGLGLSVSHSIIKKHGGRLEVHSTPGEGTTFSIFLPCPPPQP